MDETARYLGNTPAVCRASYIDPRVIDRFEGGLTIAGVLPDLLDPDTDWPEIQPTIEAGVLDLIAGDEKAEAVESAPAVETPRLAPGVAEFVQRPPQQA